MLRVSDKEARKLGLSKKKAKAAANGQPNKTFLKLCQAHGLPEPVDEYKFCEGREWRFDWLFEFVALEIEGNPFAGGKCEACGMFKGGRHNIGAGFIEDMKKYREAAIRGYVVIRVLWEEVESGEAFALVKRALEGE